VARRAITCDAEGALDAAGGRADAPAPGRRLEGEWKRYSLTCSMWGRGRQMMCLDARRSMLTRVRAGLDLGRWLCHPIRSVTMAQKAAGSSPGWGP
jgi:hypothetical protein